MSEQPTDGAPSTPLRRALRAIAPTPLARVGLALATVFAGAICFVPGLWSLDYHASLASALFCAVLSGLAGASVGAERRETLRGAFASAARTALALAAVPLVALWLNALRIKNCDLVEGTAFYLIGPVFSCLFASQLGAACGLLTRRRYTGPLLFLGVWFVWVLVDLWRFYSEPPIFAYDAFVGFFSGAVYDDLIQIDATMLLFRLANLAQLGIVWALAALLWDPLPHRLSLTRLRGRRLRSWAPLAVCVLVVAALTGASGAIGYQVSREHIEQVLGGRIGDDRIVLYYDRQAIGPEEAAALLQDHAFRLSQLEGLFGVRYPERIRSYVYANDEQKRALMGARNVYIAKPWLSEIHLSRVAYGAPVVHHELAHVYLGQFAGGLLHVPTAYGVLPHMALIEGAAEAVEWYGGRYTPHQWSAALRREQLAPSLEAIMGPEGFWQQSAGRAYTVAGSFVRWLLDTHGPEPFRRVYEDADFDAAYGKPLEALASEWEAFLDGLELPPELRPLARERYHRKAVLYRTCPLEIPRLERQARSELRQGDVDDALATLRKVADFVPDEPRKKLSILQVLAREGDASAAEDQAARILASGDVGPALEATVTELVGDALWRAGRQQEAARTYRSISDLPMDEGGRRNLLVKRDILASIDREPILGPYLMGPSGKHDEAIEYLLGAAADLPGDPLAMYLLGRRLAFAGRHAEAARLLQQAIGTYKRQDPPDLSRDLVVREATRLLGKSLLMAGEPEEAERVFTRAAELADATGDRLLWLDWAVRARWLAEGKN